LDALLTRQHQGKGGGLLGSQERQAVAKAVGAGFARLDACVRTNDEQDPVGRAPAWLRQRCVRDQAHPGAGHQPLDVEQEQHAFGVAPAGIDVARVTALRALNQANSVLLARRRREVNWALRHLGRVESPGVYDSTGQPGARPQARCLGVG